MTEVIDTNQLLHKLDTYKRLINSLITQQEQQAKDNHDLKRLLKQQSEQISQFSDKINELREYVKVLESKNNNKSLIEHIHVLQERNDNLKHTTAEQLKYIYKLEHRIDEVVLTNNINNNGINDIEGFPRSKSWS